jgi:hypothetical protein
MNMDSNTPKALAEASPALQELQWKYDFNNLAFDALETELQDLRNRHLPAFQAAHPGKGNYAQALFEDMPEVRQIKRAMAQCDRNALTFRAEFYGESVRSFPDILLKYKDAKLWLWQPEASEYADEMAEWLRSMFHFLREQASAQARNEGSSAHDAGTTDLDAVYEVVREAQAMVRLAHQALRQIAVMPLATPFADCHQDISDIARTTEAAARSLDTALSRIDLVDAQASASA